MTTNTAPEILKLLSHDLRWQIVCALTHSDLRVFELVEIVAEQTNLVSYHLKKLRDAEIIHVRRSDVDGRDVYYNIDFKNLQHELFHVHSLLHMDIKPNLPMPLPKREKPLRVLFLCTHNSGRSQIAEAFLRHLAPEQVEVFSAGNNPISITPEVIQVMEERQIDISEQYAKSARYLSELHFDYVITVCDMARELCPTFANADTKLHWGFPDPTHITDKEERLQALRQIADEMQIRIQYFLRTLSHEAKI